MCTYTNKCARMSARAILSLESRDEVGSRHIRLLHRVRRSTQTLRTLQRRGVRAYALVPALPPSDPCSNFLPGGCWGSTLPKQFCFFLCSCANPNVRQSLPLLDPGLVPHSPWATPTPTPEHGLWSPGRWAHCAADSCLSQRGRQLPVTRCRPAAPHNHPGLPFLLHRVVR